MWHLISVAATQSAEGAVAQLRRRRREPRAESNLTVQIAALRRALSKEPDGDRWIQTLPRRGYRFVGAVKVEQDVAVTATSLESRSTAPQQTKQTEPERRQPTIAACELVFASTGLDVDDLRDIIEAYCRLVAEICGPRRGAVDMHIGNTVVVHFGWRVAREDDAEGACAVASVLRPGLRSLASRHLAAVCRTAPLSGRRQLWQAAFWHGRNPVPY